MGMAFGPDLLLSTLNTTGVEFASLVCLEKKKVYQVKKKYQGELVILQSQKVKLIMLVCILGRLLGAQ